MCESHSPDLILLDVNLGNTNGLDVCKQLKAHSQYSHIPVIFITSIMDLEAQDKCWQVGGVDFVSKPVYGNILLNKVNVHLTIKKQADLLKTMCEQDSLTGFNRRYGTLEQNIRLAKRYDNPLSVLMIDIDWFKEYNEAIGHQQGDCLKLVAQEIKRSVNRSTDTTVRFGGEELMCITRY